MPSAFELVAFVAFVVASLITLKTLGPRTAAALAVLYACCTVPLLLTPQPGGHHVGIAGSAPELRVHTVAILLIALVIAASQRTAPIPRMFWPSAVGLGIGVAFLWPVNSLVLAGVEQLLLAMMAWACGMAIASGRGLGHRGSWCLTLGVLGIVLAQLVASGAQLAGLTIEVLTPVDADILGNRVNGTTNHPGTLGKVLFLLMMLLLPATRSEQTRVRRAAWLAISLAFVPLALSQGRANIAACVALLVIWALLLPGESARTVRKWILVGAAGVAVAMSGVVVSRFIEDPAGGVRLEITAYALELIARNPLTGTGPNYYTSVNGPETGSWIPVHNSFLLLAAELGLIGFAAFVLPIVWTWARAWRARSDRLAGDGARAIVASVPGVLVIGLTGWGLLGTSVLALWFFVYGFLEPQRHDRRRRGSQVDTPALEEPPKEGSRGDGELSSHGLRRLRYRPRHQLSGPSDQEA